jgi:hypothetical protein
VPRYQTVNAFTDREETDTSLDRHLPFLLDSKLRDLGAIFVATPNWTTHFEVDGNLITKAIIEKLGQ